MKPRSLLHAHPRAAALLLGGISVLGYAPFYLFPLPLFTLAALFCLWQHQESPRQGWAIGFCYGLGLYGAGIHWIYVSLHDFGGMPLALAGLSTAALCAFTALFPALAGWLSLRFRHGKAWAMPTAWVLTEWILNWIFTGFPWMTLGNSQVPSSPLAGYAPVLGIFGVSLAAAASAALLAVYGQDFQRKRLLWSLLALGLLGGALKTIPWSTPLAAPIRVSLLQGNITQDLKWQSDEIHSTLLTYLTLARQHPAPLMVLPETAIPLLLHEVPAAYLNALAQPAIQAGGNVLLGVPESVDGHYYNSVVILGSTPGQGYRKSHLVPFGEFIPFKAALGWVYQDWLHIPLADLTSGNGKQQPLSVAGQKIAVNICYEDVFGEEIIRQLPEATLLVNVSNDAWYGDSLAMHQHLQMSQARALETGRMMLRATNTGMTAIISPKGEIVAQAAAFTTTALTGVAQGYRGATPYVRLGNWPVIALILLLLGVLWRREKK